MPKRSRSASDAKSDARPYKRSKKSWKAKSSSIQGFVSGMPKTRRVKQRYNEVVSVTSTVGGLGTYVYRANSCFDPNLTGTGHQPMGFDQMSALYNHYTVIKSKIAVNVMDAAAVSTTSSICGVHLSDDTSTPYSNHAGYIEAQKGSWQTRLLRSTTSAPLRTSFDAAQFFDVKDVKDNESLGAAVNANPTEQADYIVWYQTLDSTTNTAVLNVVIDYWVEFSEPADLGQS